MQPVNIDSNYLKFIPNQQVSVPDPIAMQLMADVEHQIVDHQLLSMPLLIAEENSPTEAQEDDKAGDQQQANIEHQMDNEQSVESEIPADGQQLLHREEHRTAENQEFDENQSPNTNQKQQQNTDIELQKSSKKHASSEMKFRFFEINWNKISDSIIKKLTNIQQFKTNHQDDPIPASLRLTKTDTTSLVNNIVDQLRIIDSEIKANVMEVVARQLLSKYPCLELVDDDGCGNGMSYVIFKHKMINHNNYLNRFKDSSEQKDTANHKGRNVRAGTLKVYWSTTKKDCEKDILSKLRRDEPELLTNELLAASQAYIRYQLSESKHLGNLLAEYPVFRRRSLLNYHFVQATGVNVDDLRKYYCMKRAKIISYSSTSDRNISKLSNECCDLEIFGYLARLVGENINDLILKKEIGTRIDEIHLESTGPLVVSVDLGEKAYMYYVYADHTRVTEGTKDIICAMQDIMCTYYVHNYKYLKPVSKLLELIQQYFLKITPSTASKSNAYRVGNQQRVVRRVIDALAKHECDASGSK
ncbi:uncharacterized protein LOC134202880 isoform X2 [Armigeres subalbatus]